MFEQVVDQVLRAGVAFPGLGKVSAQGEVDRPVGDSEQERGDALRIAFR
jgi:hypothetical protein